MVFQRFYQLLLRSSTQVTPVQRKPFWKLDAHQSTTISSCLHDINAPICLPSGLRVRITADRKDRYTLLPEFPFLIILKLKMAVFLKVSFRSFNIYIRFALHTDSGFSRTRKKETSARQISKSFFISRRYNQPAHRV